MPMSIHAHESKPQVTTCTCLTAYLDNYGTGHYTHRSNRVCVISAWTFFKETYISHPHEVSPRTTLESYPSTYLILSYLICPFTLYLQTNLSKCQSTYLQYLFIHLVTCLVVVPFTYLSTYWPLCLSLAAHLMSDGQASLSNPHTYSSVSQLSYQCHQGHFSTSHPTSFTSESFCVHCTDCAAVLFFRGTDKLFLVTVLLKREGTHIAALCQFAVCWYIHLHCFFPGLIWWLITVETWSQVPARQGHELRFVHFVMMMRTIWTIQPE